MCVCRASCAPCVGALPEFGRGWLRPRFPFFFFFLLGLCAPERARKESRIACRLVSACARGQLRRRSDSTEEAVWVGILFRDLTPGARTHCQD